jgi:hypothetical protein
MGFVSTDPKYITDIVVSPCKQSNEFLVPENVLYYVIC